MAIKIERPDDSKHANMILYGRSAVGKTYLCGTAADYPGRTLIIDFDSGTATLRGKEIDVFRPVSWEEIQDVYLFLLRGSHDYRLVALDSVTECSRRFSAGFVMGDMGPGRGAGIDLTRAVAPSRQDYGRIRAQMWNLLRAFRDLAYLPDGTRRLHVVMTALERYDEDTSTYMPNLLGSLSYECGQAVDMVLRLSKERVIVDGREHIDRFLLADEHTDTSGHIFSAKNRGDRLPRGMWRPTMEKILRAWEGTDGVDV